MDDFYDNFFDTDDNPTGITFSFTSDFRILDSKGGYKLQLHKLYKRSYKGHEKEMYHIIQEQPININDVLNMELSCFKINKLYKGFFTVIYYDNNEFDLYLKEYIKK
jgi:hypothetical protein